MRRNVIVALVVAGLTSVLLADPALRSSQQSPSPEAQLVGLVRVWLDASAVNDHDTLDRLIAEDFVGMAAEGKMVSKGDIVPTSSDAPHFPKTELKETTARIFGDAGVVLGRAASVEPEHPWGFRFAIFWVKRSQGWQMVAANLSPVATSQP
jgi:hypothetical protein